jgi:hypothetical protein
MISQRQYRHFEQSSVSSRRWLNLRVAPLLLASSQVSLRTRIPGGDVPSQTPVCQTRVPSFLIGRIDHGKERYRHVVGTFGSTWTISNSDIFSPHMAIYSNVFQQLGHDCDKWQSVGTFLSQSQRQELLQWDGIRVMSASFEFHFQKFHCGMFEGRIMASGLAKKCLLVICQLSPPLRRLRLGLSV